MEYCRLSHKITKRHTRALGLKLLLCFLFVVLSLSPASAQKLLPERESERPTDPASVYARIMESEIFLSLTPELQDEIITESEFVFQTCTSNVNYATYHDCECIAPNFIEARLDDPTSNYKSLMSRISSKCPNSEGIAGMAFNGCSRLSFVRNKDPGFCECVANSVARQYQQRPIAHVKIFQKYNDRAFSECN